MKRMAIEPRPSRGSQPGGVPDSDLPGPSEKKGGSVTLNSVEQQAGTATFCLKGDPGMSESRMGLKVETIGE